MPLSTLKGLLVPRVGHAAADFVLAVVNWAYRMVRQIRLGSVALCDLSVDVVLSNPIVVAWPVLMGTPEKVEKIEDIEHHLGLFLCWRGLQVY